MRGPFPREGVGRAYDVMDHEVPPYRPEIQVRVFVLGVPQHASGVDLALALACLV